MAHKECSLDAGVAGVIAMDAGIEPQLAVDAGENAQDLLSFIRDAGRARTAKAKSRYLRKAQAHLKDVSAREHPDLVQAAQTRILALLGRGGDTELAHVTPGEMVLPAPLQTPEVMAAVQAAAQNAGIDVGQYTVGAQANSVNPETGMVEFQGAPSNEVSPRPDVNFNINKFMYDSVNDPARWLSAGSRWLGAAGTMAGSLPAGRVPGSVLGGAGLAAMFAGEGLKREADKMSEDCIKWGLNADCS